MLIDWIHTFVFRIHLMQPREILNSRHLELTLNRLCYQLIENHNDFANSALIGLQPRGIYLSKRIHERLVSITGNPEILHGFLDVTFYRDDFRRKESPLVPQTTNMDFIIEDKKVVLIDDVLFTGRTIRAGLDALMDYGRPRSAELMVLIDRRFSRHLPIQPDYIGKTVDSVASERVAVEWKETDGEDRVTLFTTES